MSSTSHPSRTPGEILKDLRRLLAPPGEARLSQGRLGKALNLSAGYIQKMETGERPVLYHHTKELELLRPADEPSARQFDLLLEELRTVVLANVRSKLGVPVPAVNEDHEAQANELKTLLDALLAKIDMLKSTVDASSRGASARLHGLLSKTDRTEAKIDSIVGRQYKAEKNIIKAVNNAAILIACGCVAMTLILAGCLRTFPNGFGAFASRILPASADMGDKKTGQPMPNHPLPHQATGTCRLGETKLFNGCWLKAADQSPPCFPGFYAYENGCYLPIAADPLEPVSAESR